MAQSTFDNGTESWSLVGGKRTYHPAGYVSGKDHNASGGGSMYWVAPVKFRNDISAAYNELLTFDAKLTHAYAPTGFHIDLVSISHDLTLRLTPSYSVNVWQTHEVLLSESANWIVTANQSPATKQQIIDVLTDLTALRIYGETGKNEVETIYLDNVVLYGTPPCQTVSKIYDFNDNLMEPWINAPFPASSSIGNPFESFTLETRLRLHQNGTPGRIGNYSRVNMNVETLADELGVIYPMDINKLTVDFQFSSSVGYNASVAVQKQTGEWITLGGQESGVQSGFNSISFAAHTGVLKSLSLYTSWNSVFDQDSYIDDITVHYENCKGTVLSDDMSMDKGECPFCGGADRQNNIGDPINTKSGNFNHKVADISIPTLGQSLKFERTYNSLSTLPNTVLYDKPLGHGWTHNYDVDLTFPDDPYGEPDTVILKAHHGSRLRFADQGDGTYQAFPGIWADMTWDRTSAPYHYVIETANQTQYTFEEQVDPEYGGNQILAGIGNPQTTAIAHNPTQDEYLLVVKMSGFEGGSVAAYRLDSSGQPIGAEIFDADSTGTPHVVYNGDIDEYLVVWHEQPAFTGLPDAPSESSYIIAQRVDALTGLEKGGPLVIATSAPINPNNTLVKNPRVAYDPSSQQYLIVWSDKREGIGGFMDGV